MYAHILHAGSHSLLSSIPKRHSKHERLSYKSLPSILPLQLYLQIKYFVHTTFLSLKGCTLYKLVEILIRIPAKK